MGENDNVETQMREPPEATRPVESGTANDRPSQSIHRRSLLKAGGVAGAIALAGSANLAAAQEGTVPTAGKGFATSQQEIPAGDGWTSIQYDNAGFDTGSFDTDNDYFVVPEDGVYVVSVANEINKLPDGAECTSAVRVNGERVTTETMVGSSEIDVSTTVSAVQSLSKGARIGADIRHTADQVLELDRSQEKVMLSVSKVGPASGGLLVRESAQDIPGDESWSAVNFDATSFDEGGTTVTDDGKLVASADGIYVLGTAIQFDDVVADSRYLGGITVNGDGEDSVLASESALGYAGGTSISAHATTIAQLSAGDEVGAAAWQDSGAATTVGGSTPGTVLFAARLGSGDETPAARAYVSGDPDTPIPNSWYPPKWDTDSFNTGGIEVMQGSGDDDSDSGTPGYLSVSESGYYLLGMNVEVDAVPDETRIVAQLRNGTGYQDAIARNGMIGAGNNPLSNHVATVEQLSADSVVGGTVWTDTPGNFTLNGGETTSYIYAIKLADVPDGPTTTLTPMPTPAEPTPTTEETTEQDTETASEDGPGFGVWTALSALGAAGAARYGWQRLAERDEE